MRSRTVSNPTVPREVTSVIDTLPLELREDALALWHLVREVKPDALHGWQDRAGLAAGLVGELAETERVIMSLRNTAPDTRRDRRLMSYKALYQDFLNGQNRWVTANAKDAGKDFARWLERDESEIHSLKNGIDTERFHPGILRPRTGDEPIRLGGLFRLAANKCPILWLDCVSALRHDFGISLTPVLRGNGPMQGEIEEHARKVGLEDLDLQTGLSEPSDLYGQMDAVLLVSRVEGIPNVLLEAQACGLPVAGTDVGGTAEAILRRGEAAGLLLPFPAEAGELAKAVASWLPAAVSAPSAPRVNFVKRSFGLQALAGNAMRLYLGQTERQP